MRSSDPVDTVRIYGGSGLSAPDTEVMAAVCVWLAQMVAELQRAIGYLLQAQGALEQAVHRLLAEALAVEIPAQPALGVADAAARGGPVPVAGTPTPRGRPALVSANRTGISSQTSGADPLGAWLAARAAAEQRRAELQDRARRAQMVNDQVGPVLQLCYSLAEQAQRANQALRRAAAGYEAAERQVTTSFLSWHQVLGAVKGQVPVSELLVRGLAPYSDELVGGLAAALAPLARFWLASSPPGHDGLAVPGRAGQVTKAAWVLSHLAHRIVPPTSLVVTETVPGHGPLLGCPAPMPSWQGTASGGVSQALTRLGDLHPFDPQAPPGGAYPDCSRVGLPKGTIAIEKITRVSLSSNHAAGGALAADGPDGDRSDRAGTVPSVEEELSAGTPPTGSVSKPSGNPSASDTVWAVYIPGTQNFAPGDHAFDGVSDLDLMAGQPSQVGEQVLQALELVGAQKGEPVVLIGHSLGGIAAASIAASAVFQAKYDLGGVVTAGSPTATFPAQSGVPYLHIENDEELVSNLDGKSGDEGPASETRVIVTRRLGASDDAVDQAAAASLTGAHPIETHQRTLELALDSGSPAVHNIVAELDDLLSGEASETRFFTGRRVG